MEGDIALHDLGHGLPFRPGTFDGAISISAVQWLCNADKKCNEPRWGGGVVGCACMRRAGVGCWCPMRAPELLRPTGSAAAGSAMVVCHIAARGVLGWRSTAQGA